MIHKGCRTAAASLSDVMNLYLLSINIVQYIRIYTSACAWNVYTKVGCVRMYVVTFIWMIYVNV